MDTFIHYGTCCGASRAGCGSTPTGEALSEDLATRIACGSARPGLPLIENTQIELSSHRGPRRITPFFVPASIINMVAGHVSMRFGFSAESGGYRHAPPVCIASVKRGA